MKVITDDQLVSYKFCLHSEQTKKLIKSIFT